MEHNDTCIMFCDLIVRKITTQERENRIISLQPASTEKTNKSFKNDLNRTIPSEFVNCFFDLDQVSG